MLQRLAPAEDFVICFTHLVLEARLLLFSNVRSMHGRTDRHMLVGPRAQEEELHLVLLCNQKGISVFI